MAEKAILKVLADGQLTSVLLPLYVVNNDESTEIHQIIIANKDTAARTVNVYVSVRQPTGEFGTPRLITPSGLILDAGDLCYVLDDPMQFNVGDRIMGIADIGNLVDYLITGVEYEK